LDPDWSVPSNRPFANYTNLSGGDYIFRVRGSNNDGVWNEAGVKLHIRIIPPFYQTTWFYILCVIVSLLSVAVFVRVREAKSKREKKTLEEKVVQRTAELAQKNQDILDSINYARRIQEAILPERRHIFDHLEDAFILYLPKDIVSGDFYWFAKKGSKKIIAAVDCTGHGVPGAFMSMIGNNLLNQIVMENGETDPGRILELLNKGVQRALKQGEGQQDTNDGMDVAMCVIDSDTDELHFAGAYRPLFMVNANEIAKTSGDKYPIGGAHMQLDRTFHTQTQKISKGDCFYIFSDGYPDQFGGPKGKKFMGKRFQQLILDVCELPMQEQKTHFEEALRAWAADYGQVDDILVIGVRY
jgi:serine phosphatase RsbU (regulator of sigma subunit)